MAEVDDADFLAAANASEASTVPSRSGGNTSGRVVQPTPQDLPSRRQGPSSILVSTRQKGNPILQWIKSLPYEYSDIPADYVLGATTCALFLSLKYHRLHPEYIYSRLKALGKLYNLRILLVMVGKFRVPRSSCLAVDILLIYVAGDILYNSTYVLSDLGNHEDSIRELSKTSMINGLTIILCWSAQEAGRYLELFKSYEHASPASIRAHQATTYEDSLIEFITTPRNINKTDATSLIGNFGSLRAAVNAEPEELAMVPGWGEKKVKAWTSSVREPFRVKRAERTNIGLHREASSMMESGRGSSTEHSRGATPVEAIPISSAAALKHQPNPGLSRENTRPEGSNKRPRLQELTPDEIDDAEAIAALEAAEAADGYDRPREIRKESALASGVAAALAKLRDNS